MIMLSIVNATYDIETYDIQDLPDSVFNADYVIEIN